MYTHSSIKTENNTMYIRTYASSYSTLSHIAGTYVQTYVRTCVCVCVCVSVCVCVRARARACTYTQINISDPNCLIHMYIHTYICTYIHMYVHTYVHTYAQST